MPRYRSVPAPLVLQPPALSSNRSWFTLTPSQLDFEHLALKSASLPAYLVDNDYPHQHTSINVIKPGDYQLQRFSFFNDFPREIRDKIYQGLLGNVKVMVNKKYRNAVHIVRSVEWPIRYILVDGVWYQSGAYNLYTQNWLVINKQFFFEAREALWRQMSLVMERRWDALNVFTTGIPAPTHHLSLFPPRTPLVCTVRELTINLCDDSDFGGTLHLMEVVRVTQSIIKFSDLNMPRLKYLTFIVDRRARISSSVICFMPDSWFLEAVLQLRGSKEIRLLPGPSLSGRISDNKRSSKDCLLAMNAVLRAHLLKPDVLGNSSGLPLQIQFMKLMIAHLQKFKYGADARQALEIRLGFLQKVQNKC